MTKVPPWMRIVGALNAVGSIVFVAYFVAVALIRGDSLDAVLADADGPGIFFAEIMSCTGHLFLLGMKATVLLVGVVILIPSLALAGGRWWGRGGSAAVLGILATLMLVPIGARLSLGGVSATAAVAIGFVIYSIGVSVLLLVGIPRKSTPS